MAATAAALGLDPLVYLRCTDQVERLTLEAAIVRAEKKADNRDKLLANRIAGEVGRLF